MSRGVHREHCELADANAEFEFPNKKGSTTSTVEYRFVVSPELGADGRGEPFEPYPKGSPRRPLRIVDFEAELKKKNQALAEVEQPPLLRDAALQQACAHMRACSALHAQQQVDVLRDLQLAAWGWR